MAEAEARGWYHLFVSAVYFTPLAFGVPGVLMLAATLVFRAGRLRFAHIPPAGGRFVREALGRDGLRAMGRLIPVYLCVAMFWALFDQTGSSWVLQAREMDRRLFGVTVLPAQIQAANPLLVMLLIPLFSYRVYPAIDRFWRLTELRKIGLGMVLTVAAFGIPAWIQSQIDQGLAPSIAWQLLAYGVLTAVLFTLVAWSYRGDTYLQESVPEALAGRD